MRSAEIHQSDLRTILDVGARNVNGTLRTVAPAAAEYIGIDLEAGPGATTSTTIIGPQRNRTTWPTMKAKIPDGSHSSPKPNRNPYVEMQ
jgi:hypothetical protein